MAERQHGLAAPGDRQIVTARALDRRSGWLRAIQATAHATCPPPELEFIFLPLPVMVGSRPPSSALRTSNRLRQPVRVSVGSAHSLWRGHLVDIVTILTRRQGVNHDTCLVISDIDGDAFVLVCKCLSNQKKVRSGPSGADAAGDGRACGFLMWSGRGGPLNVGAKGSHA
jgi:hypothetical protein